MITIPVYQATLPVIVDQPQSSHNGLARLFAAAVVNKQFCQMLLTDPERALEEGYQGETFLLTGEERELLLSIRAISLSDLAKQVTRTLTNSPSFIQPTLTDMRMSVTVTN